MKRRWMVAMASFVLLSMGTPLAVAQQEGDRAPARKKRITFDDDTFVIQGKIVKPQVQFIISREKGTSADALELRESFIPKILDSVQQPPF